MEFRRSQIGDLDQIVRIAEDAKAFLRASGVSQWQRGTYPDRALFASEILGTDPPNGLKNGAFVRPARNS